MTSIERTAYPQFKRLTSARVLHVVLHPDGGGDRLGSGQLDPVQRPQQHLPMRPNRSGTTTTHTSSAHTITLRRLHLTKELFAR